MVRTLSVERAVWALDLHGMQHRPDGAGWLEVLLCWKGGEEWQPCPRTWGELLAWLGY